MKNLHEVLLNQLRRLQIDYTKEPQDSPLLKLLSIVSDTYSDYDEHRYAIERSLEISSEEIELLNKKYEIELRKINTVSYDGMLTVNLDWKVTSLNSRGASILNAKEEDFLGEMITNKLLFLNSQKVPLDFRRLQHHFECGNNYECKQGVIVYLDLESHLFYACYTIAPFYLNDQLYAYVIIFRDITSDIEKENERKLNLIKQSVQFKQKERAFFTCAKNVLVNNHNGILATELQDILNTTSNKLIKNHYFSAAMTSNLSVINDMLTKPSILDSQNIFFFIENLMPNFHKYLEELRLSPNIELNNSVPDAIFGEPHVFEELFYELLILVHHLFKSACIDTINFKRTDDKSAFKPWIQTEIHLKAQYVISDTIMASNIEKIKSMLSSTLVKEVSVDSDHQKIKLEFTINYPISNHLYGPSTNKVSKIRCLLLLEENSPLISHMEAKFLFNHMDYFIVYNPEEAVQKIKENRLNRLEFNFIISDLHSFELIERNVLNEISSYISKNFLGLIYINDKTPAGLDALNITVRSIPPNPDLIELHSILYEFKALFLNKSKQNFTPLIELPKFDKRILFFELEQHTEILYLELFKALALEVYLTNLMPPSDAMVYKSIDAICINLNSDTEALYKLLKHISTQFSDVPIFILSPPINDEDVSQLLSNNEVHYLVKPFSLSELVVSLELKLGH